MKIRIVSSAIVIVLVVVSAGLGFFAPGVAARVANRGIPSGVEEVKTGPQKIAVAEGIFLFISPDQDPLEVDGNSIVVVNEHDVLVFDTNVLPSSARAVLAEIRKITDKPVRYVVNSHWHPDHWDGNEVYAREFPNLEIIASAETRRLMENTMNVYGKTLLAIVAPANKDMEEQLRTGKGSDGKPLAEKDRHDIEDTFGKEKTFMAEYEGMHPALPTLTYDNRITLYHGGREFRVMHFVGNTAGDSAVYLPKEKILMAGDLLTAPVPFGADSHPRSWIESLKTLERLDVDVIIPGHGEAQRDKKYLQLVRESLESVTDQVHEALRRGMTLEETRKFVKFDTIRPKFTHDDANLNAEFDGNFATPIVRQVYDEATEELELYQ
jgi:glyoxylase-like metal-dependent hydrolase (beta-lactamase superfamily II)